MTDPLIETCWRVRARSGYDFACAIYRTRGVLEVRVTYDDQDSLVYTQVVGNLEAAREVARHWRHIVSELWRV